MWVSGRPRAGPPAVSVGGREYQPGLYPTHGQLESFIVGDAAEALLEPARALPSAGGPRRHSPPTALMCPSACRGRGANALLGAPEALREPFPGATPN